MSALWYTFDTTRLSGDSFWPSETTIDLMSRDWGMAEQSFDWYSGGATAFDDTVWTDFLSVRVIFPDWAWDPGFGRYYIRLSLSLEAMKTGAGNGYLRLTTAGTHKNVSAGWSTLQFQEDIPFASAPTGATTFTFQVQTAAGQTIDARRNFGLAVDFWKVVITP